MNRRERRARHARPGEPYTIGEGELPHAPISGQVLGAAVCAEHHTVLICGDIRGRPVVEIHMDDGEVEMVIDMLRAARAAKAH